MKKIKSISFMCFFILLTFFINSNKINATTCASITDTTAYRTCLTSLGFPDSYLDKLIALHTTYPNWEFTANVINSSVTNWNDALYYESSVPSSLLSKSRIDGRPIGGNLGYRSIDERVYNSATDTWIAIEDGVWYAANTETVAYYMDPRNFLIADSIFMFLAPEYNAVTQTTAKVNAVLPDALDNVVSSFMEAGAIEQINPIYLAAKARQEGAYHEAAANGAYKSCTNSTLTKPEWYGANYIYTGEGIYNYFNINHSGGETGTCIALSWASHGQFWNSITSTYNYMGDYNSITKTYNMQKEGTYGRPWDTKDKGIKGASNWLGLNYAKNSQNSLYLQKFQVVKIFDIDVFNNIVYTTSNNGNNSSLFWHQYATNIQDAVSQAKIVYNAGLATNDSTFTFSIPIYDAMPTASTTLPINKNPNSYLKSLTIDGTSIKEFSLPTKYEINKTFNYTLLVSTSTNSITIDGTPVNSEATVTNEGVINLPNTTNTINVIGTAANGNTTTYTLTVIKSDEVPITPNAAINNMNLKLNNTYVSGITIGTTASTLLTLASSTSPFVSAVVRNQSGTETTSTVGTGYTITINNTLTSNTYSIVQKGDTNGDADISIKDLLIVQKHLLKSTTLNGAYYQGADIDNDGNVSIKDLLIVQKHLLGITPITQ